jgi:ABC-2 type transport system permease protein
MSKLWLVASYEYKRHVFKKSFILAILSLPFFFTVSIGAGWLAERLTENDAALGYVDLAGLLNDPLQPPKRGSNPDSPSVPGLVPMIPYATEDAARAALESKEIQAYYVVAADYFETNRVDLVYIEPPDGGVTRQFWDFMQINRLTDLPPQIARRAVADSNLIVRWPDDVPGGGREFSQRAFLNTLLPLFVGIAFLLLLMMSSGYLMGTVVEEKESRTIELLTTSISSTQMMGGKITGVVAISLTQLATWIAFAALTLFIGGQVLRIEVLENLSLDLRIILPIAVLSVPAYVMIAALLTAVGATVTESQEAQQVTGLFMLPLWIPFWFAPAIIENPNSPLALALSLFPPTSLTTFILRQMFSQIPLWQLVTSAAILTACALGAVWLAGRAFRLGMLRYGQRLNWRELFGKARIRADKPASLA